MVSHDGALYFLKEKAKWIVLVKAHEIPGNSKLEENNVENRATWK